MSISRKAAGWVVCLSCMAAASGILQAQTLNVWLIEPGDPIEAYLDASWGEGETLPAGVAAILDRAGDLLVVKVAGIEGLEDGSAHVLDLGQRLAWHIRPLHTLASARLSPDGDRIAAVLAAPVAHDLVIYAIGEGSSEWVTGASATVGSVAWLDEDRISYQPWTEKGAGASVEVDLSQPGVLSDRGASDPPTEVYSCGGTNDDYNCGGSNPYPCCSNGGNCTWWAWDRACRNWNRAIAVLSCCGGSGDAWQWLQGASDRGYPTSGTPSVNSIACDSNKSLSSLGHVCWVLEVNSTQVRVSEQNCNGGYGNQERWYNRSSFEGYICNPSGGCGGGGGGPSCSNCDGTNNAAYDNWESWPPDGTQVSPGQQWDKEWRMKNNGSSYWRPECNIEFPFDGGEQFGAPSRTMMNGGECIAPGQTKTWRVHMTAPSTPGEYIGYWKTDRYGTGRFGDRVWCRVIVVNPAPVVNSHPSNQDPCPGGGANFSVSASGNSLSYRWQFNGNDISDGGHYSGTGSTNLSVSNCDGSVTGSYRCRVSNPSGSATSNSASLNLQASTQISSHPGGQTKCPGQSTTFSVSASGSGLNYRWQLNGNNLNDGGHYSGVSGSTLTVSSIDGSTVGQYRCVVNGNCGSQTSNAASLNTFAATTVTQHPAGLQRCEGANVSFSAAGTGEGAVSYRWQRDGTPLNDGGRISGAFTSSLSISSIELGDLGNYTCVVTANCGSTTSTVATLGIAELTEVTQNPTGQTVCAGQPASFQAAAIGAELAYQWQKDGVDVSNGGAVSGATTASLAIGSTTAADNGLYRCVVTGGCGTETTTAATLTVQPLTVVTQEPQSLDRCPGTVAAFSVGGTGQGALGYQWQKGGVDLADGGVVAGAQTPTLTLSGVSLADAGDYRCVITGGCGTASSTVASLTMVGDTEITSQPQGAVKCEGEPYSLAIQAIGGDPRTYEWRKNGVPIEGAPDGPSYSIPALAVDDSGDYSVYVTGSCGPPVLSNAASLIVQEAVRITAQPESAVVCASAPAVLSVTATGTGPLNYQWFKNGQPLAGSPNSNTLTINNLTAAHEGTYRVQISAPCGGPITSQEVTLEVNVAPSTTGADASSLVVGRNTGCPVPANEVQLVAVDEPSDLVTWRVRSGSEPALGTVSFPQGNTGLSVPLCYQPNPNREGWEFFYVDAEDSCGQVATVMVDVLILTMPTITGWSSVVSHGPGVGEMALPLNPLPTSAQTGNSGPASEPRETGIFKIAVDFSEAVEPADGQLGVNDVTITGTDGVGPPGSFPASAVSLTNSNRRLVVRFDPPVGGGGYSPLPDGRRYTFDLAGKFVSTWSGLQIGGDTDCQLRALVGDVNGDGKVNLIDVGATKTYLNTPVTAANCRFDPYNDGAINILDLVLVKLQLRREAP